jgi:hypothetical protein
MSPITPDDIPRGAVLPRQVIPYGCNLQTGDLMFTSGPGLAERIERWGTQMRGEAPSQADHQQMLYDGDRLQSFTIKDGPTYFTLQQYWKIMDKRGCEWIIFRHRPSVTQSLAKIIQDLMRHAGKEWRYSHLELGLQFFDCMIEKVRGKRTILFRRLGKLWKDGVVCSTGSNIILKNISWLPPYAQFFSPDDTIDYIRAHPKDWSEVVRSISWGDK